MERSGRGDVIYDLLPRFFEGGGKPCDQSLDLFGCYFAKLLSDNFVLIIRLTGQPFSNDQVGGDLDFGL
jgi:hypothetical protein